jgi:Xaa-Pro aminopeptidase
VDKIIQLRNSLQQHGLDGYIVPMNDEFNCEYVPAQSRRLEYLSGFTGSAGTLLILSDKTVFFTDGRYELQATQQLGKNYEVYISPKTTIDSFFENKIANKKIGYDEKLISRKQLLKLQSIALKNNIELVATKTNLVDDNWLDKPTAEIKPAFIYSEKYSGKSWQKKLKNINENITADNCFLTLPESVCWLLNIRGYDLPHTPFLLAFALINKTDSVTIFTDIRKISNDLKAHFSDKVIFKDLSEVEPTLLQLSGSTIQLDTNFSSNYFYRICTSNNINVIEATDPCLKPKACKNEVELENIRQAHIADAVALCKFFNWFENNFGKTEITEISLSDELEKFRRKNADFFSLSFDTIAGFASNGAIIHYHANEATNKKIEGNSLLLLDSGAQYIQGTTDITRTIAIGTPTAEQIHDFTLVLKGHIALSQAKFPPNTTGAQLDALARKPLWNENKDYAHGTGHGVGHFLNVHEGPQGISRLNHAPLEVGMVISNEPGFYKNGEYGIRIENLIAVKKGSGNFLEFETLTQVPIDTKLIDTEMLSIDEKNWLNEYHRNIFKKISPLLDTDEKEWLSKATTEI